MSVYIIPLLLAFLKKSMLHISTLFGLKNKTYDIAIIDSIMIIAFDFFVLNILYKLYINNDNKNNIEEKYVIVDSIVVIFMYRGNTVISEEYRFGISEKSTTISNTVNAIVSITKKEKLVITQNNIVRIIL